MSDMFSKYQYIKKYTLRKAADKSTLGKCVQVVLNLQLGLKSWSLSDVIVVIKQYFESLNRWNPR